MAPELVAQSPTLRKAGQDLKKAADDLDREWKNMQALASVAFGPQFGGAISSDIVSSLITASHQAATEMAHKTYDSAAKAFSSFGGAIAAMGGVYDKTEQATTGNIRAV